MAVLLLYRDFKFALVVCYCAQLSGHVADDIPTAVDLWLCRSAAAEHDDAGSIPWARWRHSD